MVTGDKWELPTGFLNYSELAVCPAALANAQHSLKAILYIQNISGPVQVNCASEL